MNSLVIRLLKIFSENDEPHSLIVLVEEELVVIDLESEKWPSYHLPYMNSLHSSAITCAQHISNVPEQLWSKIVDVGESQLANMSKRVSPVVNLTALRKARARLFKTNDVVS